MIEIRVPLEARRNPLLIPWTKSLVSFHCESSTVPEASKMKARSMDLRQAIKQRQETQQLGLHSQNNQSEPSPHSTYVIRKDSEIIQFYGLRPPSTTGCWLISHQSVSGFNKWQRTPYRLDFHRKPQKCKGTTFHACYGLATVTHPDNPAVYRLQFRALSLHR